MSIGQNIQAIRATIPGGVKLICVSKYHPESDILEAYNAGERCFGESHAQELVEKYDHLPHDIEWHFIGSLQTNKVKYVVPRVALIHSVDSEHLLDAIDKCAEKHQKIQDVLLEIHVAQEQSKHGFVESEIFDFFATKKWQNYSHVRICGLMTMGTAEATNEQIHSEFKQVKLLFERIQQLFQQDYFCELSIGMSDDYLIGIEEGSTIVRIGTAIFGKRNYN